MEKALEIKEGKEVTEKFMDLHKNNSSLRYDDGYYQLKLDFLKDEHEDEKYFAIFKSVLISNFEINHEKEELSELFSFIFYEYKHVERDGCEYPITSILIRKLGLKEYLELLKDSKFPFDYLFKLEKFKEKNGFLNLLFLEEDIIKFCSEYVYYNIKRNTYYIDIKKIEPKKYQYSYEGEKEAFDRIDKLWRERDYRGATDGCDALLKHFIKNLYEVKTGKEFSFTDREKDQEIKDILEEITSHCELSELKGSLDNAIKECNNMRNWFGKKHPPYKTEAERWKAFDKLSEVKKKLYTKMNIDLMKSLHNSLLIIQRDWENSLDK